MIDEQYFSGFPFPWLLRNSSGTLIAEGRGALFLADAEATKGLDRSHLLAPERSSGWTCCPSGYAAYFASASDKEDIWLVVYSLKVFGVSSSQGKQKVQSIKLGRQEVERYISLVILSLKKTKDEINRVMRDSIHEVRSINSDIYNAVYELRTNVTSDGFRQGRDLNRIRNIEELSELLRTRTDVLDVLSNPAVLNASTSRIPVYRAFDRLIRSLTPTAKSKEVLFKLVGNSRGYVRSSRFFDVVPYLVIQNSIKYAPRRSSIDVEFSETEDDVTVVVSSMGPLLQPSERQHLFLSGFRGKHARAVSQEGTGIGLYLLKRLVELHERGSIEFEQSSMVRRVRNVPFGLTHVRITIALDRDDTTGPHR